MRSNSTRIPEQCHQNDQSRAPQLLAEIKSNPLRRHSYAEILRFGQPQKSETVTVHVTALDTIV